MSEKIISVLSFYKFIKLQSLEILKKEIWRFMSQRNIQGTIILSPEGVNINICGDRIKIEDRGKTHEGRPILLLKITSAENHKKLEIIRNIQNNNDILNQVNLIILFSCLLKKTTDRKKIDAELRKSIEQQSLRNFLMKNVYRKDNKILDFRFNLNSLSKNIASISEEVNSDNKFINEVYFFKGSLSEYIMDEDNALIYKLFPNSKFIKIQNAGHWLHADNPNDFLSELLRLIR